MSGDDDWDVVSSTPVLSAGEAVSTPATTAATAPPAAAADDRLHFVAPPPPPPAPLPLNKLLSQLDVIVMDISGSMKSRSSFDEDQTREDVSKVVFHTFVDKMICFEVHHGLALVSFASEVKLTLPVIEEYEVFHDELGRLDATGGSTRLFDALKYAGEVLVSFFEQQKGRTVDPEARLRIFALTDGEDNASVAKAGEVADWLRQHRVVVDAFPMACRSDCLAELCEQTGGLCVNVGSLIEGLTLFESEIMIHLADRPSDVTGRFPSKEPVAPAVAVRTRCGKQQVQAATLTVDALQAQSVCLPQTTQQKTIGEVKCFKCADVEAWFDANCGKSASMKRIVKELKAMSEEPLNPALFLGKTCDGVATEASQLCAKLLLPGPKDSPYEGGEFVVSCAWPNDYPFKPPKVRFLTSVYHCNISAAGQVCVDILYSCWSPALTLHKVLLSLSSLLEEPNPLDPLDSAKAMVYRNSKSEYEAMAKSWTARYASDRAGSLAQCNMVE